MILADLLRGGRARPEFLGHRASVPGAVWIRSDRAVRSARLYDVNSATICPTGWLSVAYRFLTRHGLTESGYAVEVAHPGTDGLHAEVNGGHDLVILDVICPVSTVLQRFRP